MKADFKVFKATVDGTRFDRLTALTIGAVAILAALLGVFQIQASQEKNRALLAAARLSVEVTEKVSTSAQRSTFAYESVQQALTLSMQATARTIVGFDHPDLAAAEEALAAADAVAGQRLQAIAAAMAAEPAEGVVDPWTHEVLVAEPEDLLALTEEQNRQVDLADAASVRGQRAVLGLSIVALAGVLAGLTGVLGEGPAGRVSLTAAIAAAFAAALALLLAAI